MIFNSFYASKHLIYSHSLYFSNIFLFQKYIYVFFDAKKLMVNLCFIKNKSKKA